MAPKNSSRNTQTNSSSKNQNTDTSNNKNKQTTDNSNNKNLNKVKKVNKKYHVNKVINININNKKKVKTKNSWAQVSKEKKNSFFQTQPEKFKESPPVSKIFETFKKEILGQKIFEQIDFFVNLELKNLTPEQSLKIYDKKCHLHKVLGNCFESREKFLHGLDKDPASDDSILWTYYLASKNVRPVAGYSVTNLPMTTLFVEKFFSLIVEIHFFLKQFFKDFYPSFS